MVAKDDWRLQGQERYLKGLHFRLVPYKPSIPSEHDHCEFCWDKFMDLPGYLQEGYRFKSKGQTRWVCLQCFEDFREQFSFVLDD